MTFDPNTVWEVRGSNGDDTNGGAYVSGSPASIDYSQQNLPVISGTNASTNSSNNTITSSTATFTSGMIGNMMYLQGGSPTLTAGWYQISGVTDSHTITVDRNPPTTSSSVTFKVGGALKTIEKASSLIVAQNAIWVKAESTYSPGAAIIFPAPCSMFGYGSTRGDEIQPTIIPSTPLNSGLAGTSSCNISNFILNSTDASHFFETAIYIAADGCQIYNCDIIEPNGTAIFLSGKAQIVSYCTMSNTPVGIDVGNGSDCYSTVSYCRTDNVGQGIYFNGTNGVATSNLIIGSTYGVASNSGQHMICNNTLDQCTIAARLNMSMTAYPIMKNNLITNTTTGIVNYNASAIAPHNEMDGNAYFNVTTYRSGINDNTGYNASFPYTYHLDTILSQNPYVDPNNGDYTLNNSLAGGLVCQGGGQGAPMPGGAGGPNFGALVAYKNPATLSKYWTRDRRAINLLPY